MAKIACPKCNQKKLYKMSDGKRRCSRCQYEFIPHKLPLTFSRNELKEILHLFLMEQSSNSITEQTGFNKQRIMRALTLIRRGMTKDVPEIFSGTVEVDETYLGGQWKNKRKTIREQGTKRGRGPKNNRYSESSVAMDLSGPKSSMMLDLKHFNRLSQKKLQLVLSFVLIPGKHIPVSQHEDTSIVSSIIVNDNTRMEKEIISMALRDFGVI